MIIIAPQYKNAAVSEIEHIELALIYYTLIITEAQVEEKVKIVMMPVLYL